MQNLTSETYESISDIW